MGVTRLLANEWAKHNINVNAIAPGYMATNNTQQLRADEQRSAEILDRIPAGRWGLPSDLMGPIVFLASPASDYINGYTVALTVAGWRVNSAQTKNLCLGGGFLLKNVIIHTGKDEKSIPKIMNDINHSFIA
jgi:enoyl-[acyl-carrier-protein] reductase (NADH)